MYSLPEAERVAKARVVSRAAKVRMENPATKERKDVPTFGALNATDVQATDGATTPELHTNFEQSSITTPFLDE